MTNLRYVLLSILVLVTVFVSWFALVFIPLTFTSSAQEDYQLHLAHYL